MRRGTLIPGFWERVDRACKDSGKSKAQICREMGSHRKTLHVCHCDGMTTLTLLRFCVVTGASADWLLGLRSAKE